MGLSLAPVTIPEWDRFVSHHDQALLFHTSTWLNLLAEVYGCLWLPLGIWINDLLVGIIPLQKRRLGPFRLVGSPLMQVIASTPSLGPIVSSDFLPNVLPILNDYLRREQIDHIEIGFADEVDASPFLSLGYTAETCEKVILSMAGRTQAKLWEGLSSSCRRAVRKAKASSLSVIEPQDGDFLPAYYRLCQEVYRSSGRPPHLDFNFYTTLWEYLAFSDYLKVLLVVLDDAIVAGAFFLVHNHTAFYLSGASDPAALPFRPNNLLQWHFIEWALAQGCKNYDLGGAVVPGITRFKLGFGGSCQPYSRFYRTNSHLAGLGRAVYKVTIPWCRYITNLGRNMIRQNAEFVLV
jgi:hypothetical protein